MIGRLIDMTVGLNGRQRVTLELVGDFREKYEKLKDGKVDFSVKKHYGQRSDRANRYFHALVNKLAIANGTSDEEVKFALNVKYGTVETEPDGTVMAAILPATADPTRYHKYPVCYKVAEVNGTLCKFYKFYKHTSVLNSLEMAHLLEGTISDCKELGIDTDTPEMLARYKEG